METKFKIKKEPSSYLENSIPIGTLTISSKKRLLLKAVSSHFLFLLCRGVELDSYGEGLLALDQYRLKVNPDGLSFEGFSRGNNHTWKCEIRATCDYLWPTFLEEAKRERYPHIFTGRKLFYAPESTLYFNNHIHFSSLIKNCVCFTQEPSNDHNSFNHPKCVHLHYCQLGHVKKFSEAHEEVAQRLTRVHQKELVQFSLQDSSPFDFNFKDIAFFQGQLSKLISGGMKETSLETVECLVSIVKAHWAAHQYSQNDPQKDLTLIYLLNRFALMYCCNAHRIIKDMEDQGVDPKERERFNSLKNSLLDFLITLHHQNSSPPSLMVGLFKEKFELYVRELLPTSDPKTLELQLITVTKLMALSLMTEAPKNCVKLLEEGVEAAKKVELERWLNLQTRLLNFHQENKHNDEERIQKNWKLFSIKFDSKASHFPF